MAKKTGLTKMPQASKLLGVAHYDPQAEEVLPEVVIKGAIKVVGAGIEITARNIQRAKQIVADNPTYRILRKSPKKRVRNK